MIRRLSTAASVLSLGLCITVVVLWVRSYWRMDSLEFDLGYQAYLAECSGGEITVLCCTNSHLWGPFTKRSCGEFHRSHNFQIIDYTGEIPTRLGFGRRHLYILLEPGDTTPHTNIALFAFPYPLPIALLFVTPACWCARRIRHQVRTAGGRCFVCGYDLRASTDRCPECGTPIRVEMNP